MSKRPPEPGELIGIVMVALVVSFIALAPVGVGLAVAFDWSLTRTVALGFAVSWAVAMFFGVVAICMGLER